MICYTTIFCDRDSLKEPLVKNSEWKYVCFTDQDLKSDIWEVRRMSGDKLKVKDIKLNFSKYIDAEYSLWVDASFQIIDLNKFIESIPEGYDFYTTKHRYRDCVYDEADELLKFNETNRREVIRQAKYYKADSYPAHNGLNENGILLRRKTKKTESFCREWFKETKGSLRDQMSFNYLAWKTNFKYYSFDKFPEQFILTPHK